MLTEKRDINTVSGKNTGFFPGGKYIYEKVFTVEKAEIGKYVSLMFEGVYRDAEAFINGKFAGSHRITFHDMLSV